ncbi:PaaI family thioesterase [Antrihabitans sp. YC2-6]|uniref:PaaI family thioesterase n=1 Tax=Antrihabitans sp. YC2-6 TaxID=2799498 RepID=UPI0018F4ECC6|nr:PaaI family thioesterase [Antrihabitans sp. YC2-6]MBJ8345774.1 PaaI family thioesterase [Antrihabitans sp. YC2-6]
MTNGAPAFREIATVPEDARLLADRIRELIDACLHSQASSAELGAATLLIDQAAALLRTRTRDSTLVVARGDGGVSINNAVEGPCNPVAPPLTDLRYIDGVTHARVVFPTAHEGPPGRVHGGLVAAVLDHALGRNVAWTIAAAVTASLTVDYRKGTPLHVPLDVTARVDSVDGRKVFASAEIRHGALVTAEAKATMVLVAGLPSIAPVVASFD